MTPSEPQLPRRPRTGPLRRLGFAAVASLAVLGGLELGLRALGWLRADRATSVVSFQQQGPFEPIPVDGGLVLPSGFPRVVATPKRGRRILLVGGSAALGAGYAPFTAMSGWLERELRYADPETPVEVIDMGIGGVASAQVLELLEGSLPQAEADLVVVYSGNNEMLEAMVVQTMPAGSQRTQRVRQALWSLHLFRLIQRLVPERPEPSGDRPGGSVHDQPISLSDAARDNAREGFRRNLQDMARLSRDAGVPLVLATVATNQRDHIDPGGSPQERELFEAGRSALASGDLEAAREAFAQAEERAARPSRADRVLRRITREVASQEALPLCDVQAALAAEAEGGIPGLDFFYDSCHANQRGHQRIGATMAGCALAVLGGDPSAIGSSSPVPASGWSPWRLDHHMGQWDAQLPPDSGTAADAAAAAHLAFTQQRTDNACALYQQALDRGGPEGPLRVSLGLCALYTGRLQLARQQLAQAAALLPDDLDLQHSLITLGVQGSQGSPSP